jgi:hypothetical protein
MKKESALLIEKWTCCSVEQAATQPFFYLVTPLVHNWNQCKADPIRFLFYFWYLMRSLRLLAIPVGSSRQTVVLLPKAACPWARSTFQRRQHRTKVRGKPTILYPRSYSTILIKALIINKYSLSNSFNCYI